MQSAASEHHHRSCSSTGRGGSSIKHAASRGHLSNPAAASSSSLSPGYAASRGQLSRRHTPAAASSSSLSPGHSASHGQLSCRHTPAAASSSSLSPAAPSHPSPGPRAPPPPGLLQDVQATNAQWLAECLDRPQLEPRTNTTIYLLGIVNFAPLQDQLVLQLVQHVSAAVIAIEQPPLAAADPSAVLPYPAWIQAVIDQRYSLSGRSGPALATSPQLMGDDDADDQHTEALHAMLQACAISPPARVGRDIVDPYECFGLYPGLDFAVAPTQATQVARLMRCVSCMHACVLMPEAHSCVRPCMRARA